jgi:hypothetical protein
VISKKRNKIDHPLATLAEVPVTRVPHHKHLGLTISHDLTWNEHIEQIVDKANRRLGILRSLKFKLDRLSLEKIYKSFIRPTIEYGDVIFGTTLAKS